MQNATKDVATKETTRSVRDSLKRVQSLVQIQPIIEEALAEKIASVSMTPREDIDLNKPLAAYGMDSLVAVEIRNWIANEIAANISALDFIAISLLAGLTKAVISKSTFIGHSAMSASATE